MPKLLSRGTNLTFITQRKSIFKKKYTYENKGFLSKSNIRLYQKYLDATDIPLIVTLTALEMAMFSPSRPMARATLSDSVLPSLYSMAEACSFSNISCNKM